MPNNKFKYWFIGLVFITSLHLNAQDVGDVSSLLHTEVENWNPVYKPVIGFGVGTFNYLGEVKNPDQFGFNGEMGFHLNIATYIDNNHYYRGNFYFMTGSITGNQYSYKNEVDNFNFKSTLYTFGVNINYDFDHFIIPQRRIHPFVSLGIEMITFDTKTDLSTTIDGEEVYYNYWSDGSIRDDSEDNSSANLLLRDYTYESNVTDLDFGLDDYPNYAFAIPVEAGLDFQVTDRIMFRVATSLHYTLSDEIDHISKQNTQGIIGDNMNDMFTFSYFSLHLDLFSSDKMLEMNKLFAEIEFDNTLMGDEDGDGVFDGIDECPFTPFRVEVDTIGCPIDSDYDGIPDYKDDEPSSRYGAYVDENGVEISENDVIASLDMTNAVDRSDIDRYIRTPESYTNYKKRGSVEIPEKFKSLDKDNDNYISFDEMMNAIDSFFDFDSNLSSDDLYDLNEFFFNQ